MKNNLPQKYEESFMFKVKRFFSNLFGKKNIQKEEINPIEKEEKKEVHIEENSIEKMKKASKRVDLEEDIIKIVEKNPDLIDNLTILQLEKLNEMYDKIIEENDRKIQRLKSKLA